MNRATVFSLLVLGLTSTLTKADDVSGYWYYQTDNHRQGEKPQYIAYIKNSDPCIYLKDIAKKKLFQFCEMQPNKGQDSLNFVDTPNIYPYEMYFSARGFEFSVAGFWEDLKCEIPLYGMREKGDIALSCKSKKLPEESQQELDQKEKEHSVLIPSSVKSVSLKRVGDQGIYRLIENNSEMNPCFTFEHYKDVLQKKFTAIKHVCSVEYNNQTFDLVSRDGNAWFEKFTWGESRLAFELNKSGGSLDCSLELPFNDESTAVCIDK